jgi:hypothetical protein
MVVWEAILEEKDPLMLNEIYFYLQKKVNGTMPYTLQLFFLAYNFGEYVFVAVYLY